MFFNKLTFALQEQLNEVIVNNHSNLYSIVTKLLWSECPIFQEKKKENVIENLSISDKYTRDICVNVPQVTSGEWISRISRSRDSQSGLDKNVLICQLKCSLINMSMSAAVITRARVDNITFINIREYDLNIFEVMLKSLKTKQNNPLLTMTTIRY